MLSRKCGLMRKCLCVVLLLLSLPCFAFVSTNVPLEHWSYDAVDKLIGQGLIDSAMTATRPASRIEMARYIAEADEKFQRLKSKNELIADILERLKKEYEPELAAIGAIEGVPPRDFVKPIEDPYVKYLFAKEQPDIENIRGDQFDKGSNARVGFATRGQLFDIVGFYLHPEYPSSSAGTSPEAQRIYSSDGINTFNSSEDQGAKLIEGYVKLELGKFEIEAGKDSMWWGPGYHGAMLMSNNAEPFTMIKLSNPSPVELPWIFQGLGPSKFTWFLTQLEDDRPIPKPNLSGMRFEFKPHPAVELGLSRVAIFGGEGRPTYNLVDYWKMFLGGNESLAGKLDNDQLAGFDASLLLPVEWLLPAKTVKLYTDWAGEDEAGGLPSKWGRLFGANFSDILASGKTDLRIEYAYDHVSGNPDVFYTHNAYQAGYTYEGRIIGHHMGTDSKDLFFRLTHYLNKDVIIGLQYDKQTSNLSSNPQPTIDQIGFDITLFTSHGWQLTTGYRYEKTTNSTLPNNSILFLQAGYGF